MESLHKMCCVVYTCFICMYDQQTITHWSYKQQMVYRELIREAPREDEGLPIIYLPRKNLMSIFMMSKYYAGISKVLWVLTKEVEHWLTPKHTHTHTLTRDYTLQRYCKTKKACYVLESTMLHTKACKLPSR